MINNYQKTRYITSLKKAYSVTNQALKQISADMGCVDDLACTGLFATGTNYTTLGDNLTKYFNVVKNCKTTTNLGCWNSTTNQNYNGLGSNSTFDSNGDYTFITADGMSFSIANYANNCNTPTYSTGRTGNMTQTCGIIRIDVNGLKGPNFFGRDTFDFFITNGNGAMLYPYGGADDHWDNGSDSTDLWWRNSSGTAVSCYAGYKYGVQCAGRIMEEGWQMNY